METQQIFNIGTTVFYEGDDINAGGFGRVTDHLTDYLDDLQLEITMEDGRVISNISLQEFESRAVLGNTESAEFHVVDTWERETEEWTGLIGDDSFFDDDNSALRYLR